MKRTYKPIGWICILVYFFTFAGMWESALVWGLSASSHQGWIAYEHGEKHLILLHTENHESRRPPAAGYTNTNNRHDHEFHLHDYEQHITKKTNSSGNSRTLAFLPLVVSRHLPGFSDPLYREQSPPIFNPSLLSIQTTILLI